MKRLPSLCSTLLLLAPLSQQGVAQSPTIPGLHRQHSLTTAAVGRLLLDELHCGACHADIAPDIVPAPAPDLSDVGRRFAPDELERFIANPAGTRPGTKMPSLLHRLPADERESTALALAEFLRSLSSPPGPDTRSSAGDPRSGEELFHTVGCVACHAPRQAPRAGGSLPAQHPGMVSLDHVQRSHDPNSLTAFLFQPASTRPSGRMPDMGLSRKEAADLSTYLLGATPNAHSHAEPRAELALEGRRHFAQLGCVACHSVPGIDALTAAPAAAELDLGRGCLSEADQAPRFGLDEVQRAAIRAALQSEDRTVADAERVDLTLTAFQCLACHEREGRGGVRPDIAPYFETDEPELGEEARIPPQLTLAGAKLQGAWLRKVLFEGASVRPYMSTRMPHFEEARLAHLPSALESVDAERVEPFPIPTPTGEDLRTAKEAGRELLGIRGLSCISCHDFNGTPGPTHGGVDLINTTERLQTGWFARFLISPQTYRPGIVMPDSWPDGVAAHQQILAGDTDAQIRAIWTFLAQGRTARDPEGIRPVRSTLSVIDTTVTYRGRSQVAGFRGIAVGFPGGLSYAFDAQNGSLAALWNGDFVSARWDGQGAGDFHPLARPITLARDVAFQALESSEAPWPLRPRTSEEEPVNPDPQYPANRGYRFRGYSLDAESIPTLRYTIGSISVDDRSTRTASAERPTLRRTLRFTPAIETPLFFRAFAGEFELEDGALRGERLRLVLPDVPTLLRPTVDEERPRELLLQLDPGCTTIAIDYELLD